MGVVLTGIILTTHPHIKPLFSPIIPHQLGNRALLREGQTIMRTAYKPPYWDERNVELCFVPKNQLVESTDII